METTLPRTPPNKPASSQLWHAGYAECDITPPLGLPMSGYAREDTLAKGTIAPLSAQALSLRDANDRTALLITADVMALDRTSVAYLRHALAHRHGLPAEAIVLAVSHTHWGPALHYRLNFLGNGPAVWYLRALEEKLLGLAAEALKNETPATMAYSAFDTRIGQNRRMWAADGSMSWGVNFEGSYDTHTPVLSIRRQGRRSGPRQILLLSHACHPTSTGPTPRWSPDYPGALRDRIGEQLGDTTRTMFVMGCGGDAKVTQTDRRSGETTFSASPAGARAAGRKLADAVVVHVAEGSAEQLAATLDWHSETGTFSFAQRRSESELRELFYNEEAPALDREWARQMLAYPDARRNYLYEAGAWKLGNVLTLFALPDEVCSPLAPRTRAQASTPHAMIVAYANGVQGYIPSSEIVREGGYEGESSHRAWLLPAPFTERIDREWDKLIHRIVGGLDEK